MAHLFIQQIFIECVLCARHHLWHYGYTRKQDETQGYDSSKATESEIKMLRAIWIDSM